MRKSTLLTAVFALASLSVSADTKIFYQDDFSDEATTMANWTTSREYPDWSKTGSSFVNTPDGNYIQFGNGSLAFNGTRFSTIWGATPWEGFEIPASGYTLQFSFNFQQFGNDFAREAQRNNEIAVISVAETDNTIPEGAEEGTKGALDTALGSYYGTAADQFPGYLFKITQCKSGTAAGEGGYATNRIGGTCYFVINNETPEADSVNVAAGTWYNVTLNVVGQKVDYAIVDISGTPLKSGSYTLADGADNRAGGILHYQARSYGISQFMGIKMTYEKDGDAANPPVANLYQVQGNDRVYKVTFAEGETLHYVVPGGEEQTLDYWDAEDELTGNPGTASIVVTQSGELSAWTTKGDDTSTKVIKTVECGVIKLVDPVAAITAVSEGFGKSYTISIDNSKVLLSPAIALTYAITYDDGEKKEGEVDNGATLELTKSGTMVITANSIPVNGVEYYERSSVTIENNVEYVTAEDVSYTWTVEQCMANENLVAYEVNDVGKSHWDRVYETPEVEEKALEGRPLWGLGNPFNAYQIKLEALDEVLAPIVVAESEKTEDRNWYMIFPFEGIVYYNTGKGNNHNLSIDPKYISDDASKPNFYILSRTGSYDRPDKTAEEVYSTIVLKAGEPYSQFRFDNAISHVKVLTYKGFNADETGIQSAVKENAAAQDAPIYTLSGVRVQNASQKGIYIQNGKKFIVK